MVADYLPLLLRGAALSLCVMLCSLLVALLLGLINSLVKLFGPPWLRLFSTAYTTGTRYSRAGDYATAVFRRRDAG